MDSEEIAFKIATLEQSEQETQHRIKRIEERQDNLEELTRAFSVMQNEQEHIKDDMGSNTTFFDNSFNGFNSKHFSFLA